ncbi:phage-like element PBSX protein xkdF [Brevibacillus borstelensis AK1]|uniref:Phage-like element PBSX protein xkdF n=1 Tax=Brevibacillus borstelensis AK1 TaxID=1300222 RepID=M8DD55_9BACL|nr:XkdF-like putative serine protease domain-containing protein [Brevibacillus borstelensis]EMT54244.1 phage-like element PBSX protein xkdF [Brevibacillus borstelensis AK1]
MPYALKDARITHISLVDKGANGKPFAIIKEEGKESLQKDIRIAKTDKAKQIVYGVVYEPDVEDAHGDTMTAEEIEKAAHGFMERQNTYNIDKQHDLDANKGYVVESYIAPVDMELGDQEIKKGSWVAGVKVTDADTWAQIEKGEITGFSMWGVGKREKIEEASLDTGDETVEKGLLHSIAKAISRIIKGDVHDKPERKIVKAGRKISAARMEKLKEAHTTLTDLLAEVEDKEDEDVKTEDIQKALTAALNPITKQLQDLQTEVAQLKKDEGGEAAANPATSANPEADTVAEAIKKALEPISKQVKTLAADVQVMKSARAGSQQDNSSDPIQKNLGLFAGKL